jgi:hypothetical protein
MFRSYYVLVDSFDLHTRFDFEGFSRAFRLYRTCQPGYRARLYGVDRLDCAVLLGDFSG